MSKTPIGALASVLMMIALGCGNSGGSGAGSGGNASGGNGSGGNGGKAGSGGSGGSTASSQATGGGGSSGTKGGPCDTDPLKTGLVAMQTGVSVDAFDCQVLTWSAHYNEPDPMIFKAIMYVESRFDQLSVACPNMPCGIPSGWTASEAGCYGLMQVVPACGPTPNDAGLLPNGHPNLTTDMSSSGWTGSIFNPNNNVEIGIAGVADNRMQVMQMYPGCTTDQYTMMAVGNYNSYGSTTSCTQYNMAYDNLVLMAYKEYAAAAGYPAHNY